MNELLQCLQLNALKVEVTTSATLSNILLLLYCLTYLQNKKGFYIGAFLLIEFVGSSFLLDDFDNTLFYLFISMSFVFCYWYEALIGKNIKILFAYGIMILFQSAMAIDAYIFQDIETLIYSAYEYVVLAIHLYIIAVLIQRRALVRALGAIARSIANFLNIGYAFAFCYNACILHNKK